jgi:hypothetical protein
MTKQNLDLDTFKKIAGVVIELGDKINEIDGKVPYTPCKDIRKALQSIKVESDKLRKAAAALHKK